MKTDHQIIASHISSALKKNILLSSAFLTGALLLTGCQSTSLSSNANQSNAMTAKQTPAAAKTALAAALQKQRRQSFSYHSNVEISNDQQLTHVSVVEEVASNAVEEYCEETHDQAYAKLIAQAEKRNKEVLDADYDAQRTALKDTYLECSVAYQTWEDNKDNEDETAVTVASSYQQLFDNYDDKPKALDIKKAALLDAYLLKPLSINSQGIYQPLAGKATMLASVQYHARNHHSSINQPIYIDFKNGDIYLWADNVAMLNSEFLDDKLGTKWRNKWLKIAMDDGTLPKDFGREVIKSHFAALDLTYEAAPVSQFDYVAPSTLVSLSPKLPEHQLPAMQTSAQVIRRVQSAESYDKFYQDYMRIFYNRISQKYPELIKENESDAVADTDAEKFTSKALVQQLLAMVKSSVDKEVEATASSAKVQELYGFDKRGQLKWQHLRTELPSKAKSDKGLVVDVMQQYFAIQATNMAFPNLPSDKQVPNASNSIDVRQYGRDLMQYYRDGNGTAMGKMMFGMLPMARESVETIE
ncbi:hypothetical protein [Psychrobacter aquaticus]|uniref:Uncharacterized protein n=1 Tax=Psychrobacter aquaticus CMS 56 TaxID=1354303 RepID=U4TEF1_9GAMM|nr:hypothetical protein [Psychrobacter aquaticus]ERL57079.1 hypothetical protein M917_0024 [Psychrobacter aquaticus CMS 56]